MLELVDEGQVIESIAVADGWTEDDNTFCVVYTAPWGPDMLVGIRRVRRDLDSVAQIRWHLREWISR